MIRNDNVKQWIAYTKTVVPKFQIILIAFQCYHDVAPSYLQQCLIKYEPMRNVKSIQKYMHVSVVKTKSYGESGYEHSAPELWNGILHKCKAS